MSELRDSMSITFQASQTISKLEDELAAANARADRWKGIAERLASYSPFHAIECVCARCMDYSYALSDLAKLREEESQ